ncbi:MAG: oxidoreductase [Bacteroidota bacterium]|nr:oxidoreductase [Bacteroidota bacterium]MDP4191770.1 oxidoreductase [Bacteroidota bacterium]MDP4195444.1 oxidoreductase [Bacteroidota bacterium]
MANSVLLLGATGLVGQECLRLLLKDDFYSKIVVLARRDLQDEFKDERLESHIVNFDRLDDHKEFFGSDQIICTLGATMAKAGSKDNFYKVDYGYPYEAAKLALASGAEHYLLVSALGADENSRIFYNRVKGELERSLKKLGFRSLSIFRPSLLIGERKEFRFGEEVGKVVSNIFSFAIPPKYKPIEASELAKAIIKVAKNDFPGIRIIESDSIRTIARTD